jgi:hypothetical protein
MIVDPCVTGLFPRTPKTRNATSSTKVRFGHDPEPPSLKDLQSILILSAGVGFQRA